MQNPQWLQWARRLQALAQTGLTYCKDPFDIERNPAYRRRNDGDERRIARFC
jgi:hypothetical protein